MIAGLVNSDRENLARTGPIRLSGTLNYLMRKRFWVGLRTPATK